EESHVIVTTIGCVGTTQLLDEANMRTPTPPGQEPPQKLEASGTPTWNATIPPPPPLAAYCVTQIGLAAVATLQVAGRPHPVLGGMIFAAEFVDGVAASDCGATGIAASLRPTMLTATTLNR